MELKYGCNPNQKPAAIYMKDGSDLPITVLGFLGITVGKKIGLKILHLLDGEKMKKLFEKRHISSANIFSPFIVAQNKKKWKYFRKK